MGDIADMMIDGTLCEGCGVYLEGESWGPRRCTSCRIADTRMPTHGGPTPVRGKVACPQCGRYVKAAGLKDHQRAVHG